MIGVIWLVASIYKATQKGKKKPGPHKPSNVQPDDEAGTHTARSLLEELLDSRQMGIPEPESSEFSYEEQGSYEMEEEPVKSFQSEYADRGFKGLEALSGEGVSSIDRITFKDELKEVTRKADGQNKINLRKAIIYSTILERPYT